MQKSSFLHDLYMSLDLSEEGERKRKEEAEKSRKEERFPPFVFFTEYTYWHISQFDEQKEPTVFILTEGQMPGGIKPSAAEPA